MVLDKIFAIKIKRSDNTYSDPIPIKALAQNIQWDGAHDISIKEILGNVDLTRTIQGQLNDLQNNKISANSLSTYVGHQLQTDVDSWLRQNVNSNEVLKQTDLYGDGTIKTNNTSAEINTDEASGRQYAVVKDNSDKLSVIVPWTDTDTPADMQYIWSGICTTPADESNKSIILDKMDNFEINGDLTTINHGVTIAVYFTTGNIAPSPKLTIQGSGVGALPIYYAVDNETTLEMDVNTPEPWYTFTPGLKFFTCRKIDNKTVWLLTTVDYSLISHLNQTIATQDSPEFSGIPTAPTAATNTNNNQIATTGFVHNAIDGVLDEYLKTTTEMPVNSLNPPEQPNHNRQYPVVKDSEGNLSVNVPWSNSDADAAVQKIWTGTCSTAATSQLKIITLDNASSNFSIVNGTTIIVYFTNGNSASAPRLKIDNGGDGSINNILYQSDSNVVTVLTNASDIVGNWGAGLKIFTYYNKSSIGWLMQSPDMSHIRFLLNYKANIDSPIFTGYPTAETPAAGDNSKKLATTAFVNNAIASTSQKSSQNISKDFDANATYVAGDYVYYNGKLYKFVKTHAAGDWDRSEVDEISITGDIQSATQNLNSILVNNSSEVSLTNKGQLSHFNDSMGFIKISDTGDLIKYQYNYSNNTHKTVDPYIRTGSGSYGNGKSLIGLKFRLINSSEVPLSSVYNKFYITTEGDSPQLVYDVNSISGIWTQASLCVSYPASSSELSHIKLYLHADPNYDYGNATVTVEIKDFYVYNLTDEIADNASSRNYIINEQNRNYQNGTVTYSLPNYGTDKTLTQDGKAADAKVVGDVFNDILVQPKNISFSLSNISNVSKLRSMGSAEEIEGESTNNYKKFIYNGTSTYGGFEYIWRQSSYYPFYNKGKYLIGFNYKINDINNNLISCGLEVMDEDPQDVRLYGLFKDVQYKNNQWLNFATIIEKPEESYSYHYQCQFGCLYFDQPSLNINTTIEIKNFYIYNISQIEKDYNQDINHIINYIIEQQKNDDTYQIGNKEYSFTLPLRTDQNLSYKGKTVDTSVVKKILTDEKFLIDQVQNNLYRVRDLTTDSNIIINNSQNDYRKCTIRSTDLDQNSKTIVIELEVNQSDTDWYKNSEILIGFDHKITFPNVENAYLTIYETKSTPLRTTTFSLNEADSAWSSNHFIYEIKSNNTYRDQNKIQFKIELQYDSTNFSSNSTFEIRNFYMYNITEIGRSLYIGVKQKDKEEYINYIIQQQSDPNSFSPQSCIYKLRIPPRPDKTLSLEGKAADAAVVGKYFADVLNAPDVSRATFTSLGDTYGDLTINESAWYAIINGSVDGMVSIEFWFPNEEVYLPVVAGAKMTPWLYLKAGATGYRYTSSVNSSRLVKAPNLKII